MSELVVIAALHVPAGAEAAFANFEKQALAILGEHGARLERAIRPARGAGSRTRSTSSRSRRARS